MTKDVAALSLCILLGLPAVAFATEGGGSSRPPGLDTLRNGILAPPGWFATSTLQFAIKL